MAFSCVLLNYNDALETLRAARRIMAFECVDHIVVVDNASTDDSLDVLKGVLSAGFKKASLLKNRRNGGYGYGNNQGVKYAYEKLGAELVLIANPDAIWDEDLIKSMMSVFKKDRGTAAVGAVALNDFDKEGEFSYAELKNSGWKYRSFLRELLHCGPICKRLFSKFLDYPQSYYGSFEGEVPVYAVHGSLLMVDAKKFLKVKGYDESIFLYDEEYVLGYKFKKAGYRTYMIKKGFIHTGSHSISGSGFSAYLRQKMRQEAELIYFKKYLGAGSFGIFLARFFQKIVLLETWLWMR